MSRELTSAREAARSHAADFARATEVRIAIMRAPWSPAAMRVAIFMFDLMGLERGRCEKGPAAIATLLGVSRDSIKRAFRELGEVLVTEEPAGPGKRAFRWLRTDRILAKWGPKAASTTADEADAAGDDDEIETTAEPDRGCSAAPGASPHPVQDGHGCGPAPGAEQTPEWVQDGPQGGCSPAPSNQEDLLEDPQEACSARAHEELPESPPNREGWLQRALAALWSGHLERYRERFGRRAPDVHLEQLRPAARWVIDRLAAGRPGTPEELAEHVLDGYWLRTDLRPQTPVRWLAESPEAYLVAADEAARVRLAAEEREREERTRALEERRVDAQIRREGVSAAEVASFTAQLRGAERRVQLPAKRAARAVSRVVEEVAHTLPDPLEHLVCAVGDVWPKLPPPAAIERMHAQGFDVQPHEGKWRVVALEETGP